MSSSGPRSVGYCKFHLLILLSSLCKLHERIFSYIINMQEEIFLISGLTSILNLWLCTKTKLINHFSGGTNAEINE